MANDFKRIARSEAEGELESFGLVYASHAAGSHLTVASAVEVLPLARRLPRVVDRAAARRHKAERAGLEAHRDGRTRYSAGNEKRQGICSGDKRELQRFHHETVNLYGARLVLLGNLIDCFSIKRP